MPAFGGFGPGGPGGPGGFGPGGPSGPGGFGPGGHGGPGGPSGHGFGCPSGPGFHGDGGAFHGIRGFFNLPRAVQSSHSDPDDLLLDDEPTFFQGLVLAIRGHNIYEPASKKSTSSQQPQAKSGKKSNSRPQAKSTKTSSSSSQSRTASTSRPQSRVSRQASSATHPNSSAPQPRRSTRPRLNLTPTPYHVCIMRVCLILSVIFGCCMIMSNILAVRIWAIGPIIIDGGIVLFPLTYVIGDVMVLLFNKKITETVTTTVCAVAAFLTLIFALYSIIPDPDGFNNPATTQAFGFSAQINLASIIAFFVSRKANNTTLRKRLAAGKSKFWSAFWSSVYAHFWDSSLFTLIAFWGRHQSPLTLAQQALTSMLVAIAIEFLLNKTKFWIFDYIYAYLKAAKNKAVPAPSRPSKS